jgi:tetratricopeptide (TPR) repeat protein
MNPPSNQVDKHGFPVPGKFEEPVPPGATPPPSGKGSRVGRVVLGSILVAIVAAIAVEAGLGAKFRETWVNHLLNRAVSQYSEGDVTGAIEDLDEAFQWLPEDVSNKVRSRLMRFRAQCHLELKQFEPALEDASRAVDLDPKASDPYMVRAIVYQRMNDYPKALEDMDRAVEFREDNDSRPLNTRAYFRALAKVELAAAFADIQRAIDLWGGDNSAYLDTRGYLQLLLGNTDAAMSDMQRAVHLAEEELAYLDRFAKSIPAKQYERRKREANESLSVLYHHRGEVYEKLGKRSEAEADLRRATELGYNPAEGVL